jgi:hypothetical protein
MTEAAIAPAGTTDLLNGGTPPSSFDAPEAASARAEIATLKADSDFFKTLQAEKDRGGPAHQKWAELHAKGWPAPIAPVSQDDVNAQASARNEQQLNTYFAWFRSQWAIPPDQVAAVEAEIRGGVIREDLHKLALEQRDLLVKDKAFYRRLLDGDMAAKEKWARTIAAIGLRRVRAK